MGDDSLMLKHKVFAYITRGSGLLVFVHSGHPEAGIQVPAGTRLEDEDPAIAVLREATEETGLASLELLGFLGEVDFPVYARGELHRRRFYHLRCTGEAAERWQWYEESPSDGCRHRILFELYWIDLRGPVPELAPGHGAMLPALLDSMVGRDGR